MALFSRTDLGIPRVTYVINLPELVYDEKDPILWITQRVAIRDPRNG